jgi:DNA-binding Xre family transcriptional regulator
MARVRAKANMRALSRDLLELRNEIGGERMSHQLRINRTTINNIINKHVDFIYQDTFDKICENLGWDKEKYLL